MGSGILRYIFFLIWFLPAIAHAATPLINCTSDGIHALTSTANPPVYSCTAISGAGGAANIGTSTSATNPQVSGDATTGFFSTGSGQVDISSGGTQVAEFSTGDIYFASSVVAIGTTSASNPLVVYSATNPQIVAVSTGANKGTLGINNLAGGNQSSIDFEDGGSYASKWQIGKQTDNSWFQYDSTNAENYIAVGTSGILSLGEGGALNITKNTGFVGIGTAAPSSSLDIVSIGTTTNSGPNIILENITGATPNSFGPALFLNNHVSATNGFVISQLQNSTSDFAIANINTPFQKWLDISQTGLISTINSIGIGSSSPRTSIDDSQNTDAIILPIGTTGTRPTGITGMERYNSTNNNLEEYDNGGWQQLASLTKTDQLVSGGATVTSNSIGTKSSGTYQVDCGLAPLQYLTDGGAFTLSAPANDGQCTVLSTNNGSAGTITFSGFSVGANTGDAIDTTNGHKFSLSIWCVNAVCGYRIAAHQ